MEWEEIGDDDRHGLNVTLNEATWIGIRVDAAACRADPLFDVLSLPTDGPAAPEYPVILAVDGVSRLVASLRDGWWDDARAQVVPLSLTELDAAVRSFEGCPVYGWEFVDPPEASWSHWRDRLSIDARFAEESSQHVLELFQEGGSAAPRHLDLRIWFRRICVVTPGGRRIPLSEFVAGGVRWWDGLHSGDQRTTGRGIFPLHDD